MSHKSDKSSLSQPLMVESDENNSRPGSSDYFEDVKENCDSIERNDSDSLGPLPAKWEKAFTENGEVYFIDHMTGTSHWLDPRLSKFQKKSLEDCLDDELPYGWEKICDPHYGIYFIDHVNRCTQYENPVIQAKRAAIEASACNNRISFTKDPGELYGQRFQTMLIKSARGLGFTIVGGDDTAEEFLQIKSVVPKGPAWLDGQLQTGDVIVYVNDICVLGYTHNQIVRLFQSISIGSNVLLEVCRGYPLPFDPNDPNTEVVTTIAVDNHMHTNSLDTRLPNLDANYNFLEGQNIAIDDLSDLQKSTDDVDDIIKGVNNASLVKMEVKVKIMKGNMGFGFTIADSACGQRVKKILDHQRCKNLLEGDIVLDINDINVQSMSHDEVVQVLKNCPYNSEATICVQRSCSNKLGLTKNKPRKLDNRSVNKEISCSYRSKTPTADIYSTQQREILPSRPKTPLIDTRCHLKTSIKDLQTNGNESFKNEYNHNQYNQDIQSSLRFSVIDPSNIERDNDLSQNIHNNRVADQLLVTDTKYTSQLPNLSHRFDCMCYDCHGFETNSIENNNPYESHGLKSNNPHDLWSLLQYKKPEYSETSITLNRQGNGFGFRIVGGIEDKSQVAVGHIVTGGAADLDGRIKSGDDIVSVDGYCVLKASHRQVVQLINAAGARGQVHLVLRRQNYSTPNVPYSVGIDAAFPTYSQTPCYSPFTRIGHTYDIVVNRNENEGFGFVIISSVNKVGSTIGRLIEDSPAERCGQLGVGDYIVAVNHIDIMNLSHGDVVNLIKESGLSVTLTIAPNPDL